MIMLQEIDSDVMYSESQLATMVNLGRTPVREALQRLALEKVIKIIPYRGIQLIPASVETQLKLLEIRREVEKLCVRLAASRATTSQKLIMKEQAIQIVELAEKRDDKAFGKLLKAIHDNISEATGNEFIKQTMIPLQILSRRFWFFNQAENQSKLPTAELNAEILNAIIHGDEELAEQASKALMDHLTDFTYDVLKRQGIFSFTRSERT